MRKEDKMETELKYKNTSEDWLEGLPIGNGRLAAMITGSENCDDIWLNHEWLWRGVHRNRDNIKTADMLKNVRHFLEKGDFYRATALANVYFGGMGGISGVENSIDSYQPAGELHFSIENTSEYTGRHLDIKHGVASVERKTVKSYFIAHPIINMIICRWEGNVEGILSYTRTSDANAEEKCTATDNGIVYECKFKGGISFQTNIVIETNGKTEATGDKIAVHGADSLTAFINIATEVKGIENELKKYAMPENMTWENMIQTHKARFAEVMERFCLEIDLPESNLFTDERIERLKNGEIDNTLPLLYFNYGRYLLVSSSICGELPANLQGKWNNSINPPWGSDYHLDINLQMNYWMAETVNMAECTEALFKYIERMIPHAKKAANDLYGCRGIYLPLRADAWEKSTPESFGWAAWIGAAAWIARHFWQHYEYTGDKDFLRERAYPLFRETARFYEDYLVEDKNGVMQIMPSQSPENRFEGTGMFPVSIGISSASDVQLAYDALGYAIKSAEILGTDKKDAEVWESLRNKLPEFKIGSDGRLLEWNEEYAEVEPGHRHVSHLYGLYPSDLFNPEERPQQYKAAEKSLEQRLSQGGAHTGWSRAWTACLYARLGKGERVWEHINAVIKEFATISLLDLHPPRIFQIDGNLGTAAAITESIAQYWGGKLHLLRALPKVWGNGNVKGLRIPGGYTLNMKWENCIPTRIEISGGQSPYNINIAIKTDKSVQRIYYAERNKDIEFIWKNGEINFAVGSENSRIVIIE